MRKLALVLVSCIALACGQREPAKQAAPEPPSPLTEPPLSKLDFDRDNLLNLAYGAAVVSRTAELSLESSAVHAIDGSAATVYTTPSGGGDQTLVLALPSRSRIARVGVTVPRDAPLVPQQVRIAASDDLHRWREVATLTPRAERTPQLVDVAPLEARYVRVDTVDRLHNNVSLSSVHAIGQPLEAPAPLQLDGCWTINGEPARFVQRGHRLYGNVGATRVSGGIEGNVARLMWRRGPMWGYAAVTLAPETRALTGYTWHEWYAAFAVGAAWFGQPAPCRGAAPFDDSAAQIFERSGRLSLYGLHFDERDRLDSSDESLDGLAALLRDTLRAAPRAQLVAHEHRQATPQLDQQRTAARLASLREALRARGIDVARIDFAAAGNAEIFDRPAVANALERLMGSSVDLVRAR
ncbi:MAG TPA: discoidin domain-containing protein [Thermoanaerobaculia bacterium]|jgi:hypothetical protein